MLQFVVGFLKSRTKIFTVFVLSAYVSKLGFNRKFRPIGVLVSLVPREVETAELFPLVVEPRTISCIAADTWIGSDGDERTVDVPQ